MSFCFNIFDTSFVISSALLSFFLIISIICSTSFSSNQYFFRFSVSSALLLSNLSFIFSEFLPCNQYFINFASVNQAVF